ncbi:hypothetical protein ON010_g13020 [Phytophthora cinnamomi]|nr:hypothetical protein ON010_g13020 [Phytophthora cinnamomi]
MGLSNRAYPVQIGLFGARWGRLRAAERVAALQRVPKVPPPRVLARVELAGQHAGAAQPQALGAIQDGGAHTGPIDQATVLNPLRLRCCRGGD